MAKRKDNTLETLKIGSELYRRGIDDGIKEQKEKQQPIWFKLTTEFLKFFCFLGLVMNIIGDNLSYTIFYGVATILSIILTEIS